MSKSDGNIRSRIDIIDTPDQIMEKIKKSHTDMIDGISYDPDNRPGVSNLLDIQSSITGESISNICEQCISLNKVVNYL
jgi:tryptophanyl-tRNA synthetase